MSNEADRAFRAWRLENEHELASIGIPLAIYWERARWNYFLDHGDCHACPDVPPFSLDELDADRLGRLHRILARDAHGSFAQTRIEGLMAAHAKDETPDGARGRGRR